jgi:hypothetical protein
MTKTDSSASSQDEKSVNKVDQSSVLHRESSFLHQEKTETQAETIARILEFVGEEGKPLKQVLEYAVKELKILKPEPLLKQLLERGHLVKVKKEGEAWLVKG